MENIFSMHSHCLDVNRISLDNGLQRGDYFIGPKVMFCSHPISDIIECIAKRVNSDEFVVFKILNCTNSKKGTDSLGKVLFHNENVVLSLLRDKPGVIHHHGLFKYCNKFILVLDCVMSHEYDKKGVYKDFINLQQYVIQRKQLQGAESLEIFCSVVSTLKMLHENNIVHRDLKLGNMIYNRRGKYVTLVNFALSKHLIRDDEMLTDQCGSLAYVSPEVLSGKPYDGKASDMWAVGVLLFTMCCGQFPFYDNDRQELFKKISAGDFIFPICSKSEYDAIYDLIKMLIVKDPQKRLTAVQTLEITQQLMTQLSDPQSFRAETCGSQVVPDQGEEVIFTDCVVPISTLNLGTEIQVPDFPSSLHINSEVPLLCDQPSASPSECLYTSSYRVGDSSLTQIAIEPVSGMHAGAGIQVTPYSPDGQRLRLTLSTEHMNDEPSLAYTEIQRVRRNSSLEARYSAAPSMECRVRRHSAAPTLESRVRQHSAGSSMESRVRQHSAGSSMESRVRQHSAGSSMESRVKQHSAAPTLENRMRQHSAAPTLESRVRRHSAASSMESRVRRHSAASSMESRVRRHSAASSMECRVRRHSAAPFRLDSRILQRRRSHDIRDEQVDLLERLHVVATRRSPTSQFLPTARHQSSSKQN